MESFKYLPIRGYTVIVMHATKDITVFGMFTDSERALQAANRLNKELADTTAVAKVRTVYYYKSAKQAGAFMRDLIAKYRNARDRISNSTSAGTITITED